MNKVSQRDWRLWSMGLALGVAALYIGLAARCGLGLPLDDGWIHQTYARNLAQSGQFAYVPGHVSSGSTSPLWTLLLTVGHLLGLPPLWWAWMLGTVSWVGTAWTATALAQQLFPERHAAAMWVGIACLGEWHLAWAAFSGMETLLFAMLSLLLIERYTASSPPFLLGLIGGLLFLTRPEGIVLLGLLSVVAGLDYLRRPAGARLPFSRLISVLAEAGAGLALLIGPYLLFNQIASGQMFPNTFYAKQSEYRELLAQPFLLRLWRVLRRPLVGAQVVLLPGFAGQVLSSLRSLWRKGRTPPPAVSPFLRLLPVVWWAAYLGLYALRLPVDYQYGRYLMPTIPFLLLYGVVGTARWLRPRSPRLLLRLVSRALPLAVACLSLAFLLIGARAYADDVCIINGEMVDVADWLRENTPPDALIAAHDIGAIGYLSDRPLLDLAGLVTPEVIPFIRDETRLAEFIVARGADYLVTFPDWYPQITADERFVLVYETDCSLTRQKGGENLAVYRVD